MPFIIPSIFTAVDKFSAPIYGMGHAVDTFGGRAERAISRSDRAFRRFTPAISEAGRTMLQYAKSAAIAGGILATISFSGKQIMDYENNLASFRTIVSDLSDKEFAKYRQEIFKVGLDTNRSSVLVATSFEKIAGLNAKFAETADGLGLVSKAAIILSKASKDELGIAAENLVGIMNQFSLGAKEADRVINVLAAGQAVGAASISQAAESYKNFGSVAAGANITLEQSTSLIQMLGKFSVFGAEAGTKLRGSILKLQQAGMGYKSGQFDINNALEEANKKIARLRTAKEKDAFMTKLFGAENISTGRILLNNIETYKEFTKAVTGTTEAQKAAAINSNTLSNRIDELKAKWTNIITESDGATNSLEKAKNAIKFVTDHMDTIVKVGVDVLIFFGAWKALLISSKIAMIGYNVVLGISMALQGQSAFTVMGSTIAYGAYRASIVAGTVATNIATAAQWLWNAAMSANPIGLIIIGIAAFIAAIVAVVSHIKGWGAQWEEITKTMHQVWNVFSLGLQLDWLILKAGFFAFVDAIVLAWKWGQNLIGNLSDEQYAKDKARIKHEQTLRVDAIKSTAIELQNAMNAVKAPAWKLSWKSSEDNAEGLEATTPAVNPKLSQQQALAHNMQTMTQKNQAEITIKDQTGSASVTKNTGIPIKMTPVFSNWNNK